MTTLTNKKSEKFQILELSDYNILPDGNMDVWGTDVSDGHHTMSELYEHRHRLFIALMKAYDNVVTPLDSRGCRIHCWKSKLHADGTMYDGWFIAGMIKTIPTFIFGADDEQFQISYHLPMKYWNILKVIERKKAPEWDGHTSRDVLERLLRV